MNNKPKLLTEDVFNKTMEEMSFIVQKLDKKIDDNHAEVMEMFKAFAENVDERFDETSMRITRLEKETTSIRATMMTKEYLDRKLFEHKADLMDWTDRNFVRKPRMAGGL